jgi:hypothetical protein
MVRPGSGGLGRRSRASGRDRELERRHLILCSRCLRAIGSSGPETAFDHTTDRAVFEPAASLTSSTPRRCSRLPRAGCRSRLGRVPAQEVVRSGDCPRIASDVRTVRACTARRRPRTCSSRSKTRCRPVLRVHADGAVTVSVRAASRGSIRGATEPVLSRRHWPVETPSTSTTLPAAAGRRRWS